MIPVDTNLISGAASVVANEVRTKQDIYANLATNSDRVNLAERKVELDYVNLQSIAQRYFETSHSFHNSPQHTPLQASPQFGSPQFASLQYGSLHSSPHSSSFPQAAPLYAAHSKLSPRHRATNTAISLTTESKPTEPKRGSSAWLREEKEKISEERPKLGEMKDATERLLTSITNLEEAIDGETNAIEDAEKYKYKWEGLSWCIIS